MVVSLGQIKVVLLLGSEEVRGHLQTVLVYLTRKNYPNPGDPHSLCQASKQLVLNLCSHVKCVSESIICLEFFHSILDGTYQALD